MSCLLHLPDIVHVVGNLYLKNYTHGSRFNSTYKSGNGCGGIVLCCVMWVCVGGVDDDQMGVLITLVC